MLEVTPQGLALSVMALAIWFAILFAVIRAGVAAGNREVVNELKKLNKKEA